MESVGAQRLELIEGLIPVNPQLLLYQNHCFSGNNWQGKGILWDPIILKSNLPVSTVILLSKCLYSKNLPITGNLPFLSILYHIFSRVPSQPIMVSLAAHPVLSL